MSSWLESCIFRKAKRSELTIAVEWARQEGWNPGHQDADVFWQTDPDGYVCVELDGEVIATGSVVSYHRHFGFMGFFIVRPDLRGKGLGRRFWNWRRDLLLSRLMPGAAIGMDGVFDMQDFYSEGGFVYSHRNLRMEGVGQAAQPDPTISDLSMAPFSLIKDYDERHFGYEREVFLKAWIKMEDVLALGVFETDVLRGYGVVRPCGVGYKIGPLFADTPEYAEKLFAALSDRASGEPLYLDTPECNSSALDLAMSNNMSEVFGCARMYYGEPRDIPWGSIYGVTSFELG